MPAIVIVEGGKPMMPGKKRGFLDYGKEEAPEKDEGSEDAGADPSEMRLQHLAEQTGVERPDVLLKLIKTCIAMGGEE